MMQPLKITAYMQDGRVATTDGYLPLDSILAAEWMRRNHPEAYYNASSHMLSGEMITPELPFERRGVKDLWNWACSFNMAPPLIEYVMYWHKRFDDQLEKYIDFGGRRGRIDIKSSKYKAYRMSLVVQLFDRLEWYAVGDPGKVLDLCRGVTHIGKKSSQGLGAVDWWEVAPWPKDWSEAVGGKLARAIPVELGLPPGVTSGRVGTYGIRPPYWHTDHQALCHMPGVGHGR